jgi:tripartite-type tricarboxylate transporter receptor subunit TctC
MRVRVLAIATAVAVAARAAAALAQNWPTRPITLVVPFTSGTTSDVVARALLDHVAKAVGATMVVDNRGGAGGNIGATMVAKAKPDGYTLLLATTGPAATNKLMYKTLNFDPETDFAPIVLVGSSPIIIVAGPNAPVKSMQELIDYAKANPDELAAGYPGNGTLGHITGELLQQKAGIKFKQAQYRGSMAIMTDLLGGHINLAMDSMAAYVPNVKAGKLRAIAIAGANRWSGLPDVATVAESGLPGFEASVWYALLAPAGTSPAIIGRLNAATNDYLKTPQAEATFANLGIERAGGTAEELKAFIAAEVAKWTPIVKAANISF